MRNKSANLLTCTKNKKQKLRVARSTVAIALAMQRGGKKQRENNIHISIIENKMGKQQQKEPRSNPKNMNQNVLIPFFPKKRYTGNESKNMLIANVG